MTISKKFGLMVDFYRNKDPYLIKRILYNWYVYCLRLFFSIMPHKGIKVIEEDWDCLLVLDACRYDMFKKVYKDYFNQGVLHKKKSLASCTKDWLLKNFKKKLNDIVYVSGTPYVTRINSDAAFDGNKFHFVEEVWIEKWKNDTTPPEEMAKAILKIIKKYPHKRIIAHFLQPHTPYIGKTKIPQEFYKSVQSKLKTKKFRPVHALEDGIKYGHLDLDLVKMAYEDNLRIALEEIKKIIDKLDGKIVITADHGECFGEKGLYFHEVGIYIKELVEVPWFIIEKRIKKNTEQDLLDSISI